MSDLHAESLVSQPAPLPRRDFLVQAAGALTAVAILPALSPAAWLGAPLRVAVIGLGKQGRAIITELQKMDFVTIAAVCDSDQQRLENGAKRAPGAATFASHKELIEKGADITACIIATPTHLHKDVALDLLGAGKHVYCEAPLAHTIEDAKAIMDAAKNAKGICAVGLEGRSNPIYKLARTFYKSDSVRDIVSMRGQAFQKTSWRVPASDPSRDAMLNWRLDKSLTTGLPGEWGTHQFDVFCWYRDAYPASIRASGRTALHKDGREVADTIAATLTWPDGSNLMYEASLANSYQGKHELLHGTNATIKLAWTHGWMFKESDAPVQGWEVYANRQQFHNDEGITLIADATKLASQGKLKEGVGLPNTSLYYALEDFAKAIADAKQPAANATDGYRATVLGILTHKAVTTGETITINPEVLA